MGWKKINKGNIILNKILRVSILLHGLTLLVSCATQPYTIEERQQEFRSVWDGKIGIILPRFPKMTVKKHLQAYTLTGEKTLTENQTEYTVLWSDTCQLSVIADIIKNTIVEWRYITDPKLCLTGDGTGIPRMAQ